MSNQKAVADRGQMVVKANELIRKARYNLTTQQQRIILYAISKIKPTDPIGTTYTFTIKELAEACGWRSFGDGGYYYETVREDITALTKPFWLRTIDANGKTVDKMAAWIYNDAEMKPGNNTIHITFHKQIQQYIFELREQYTQYKLLNILAFRGKYAIRLYEILRSYTVQRDIDNLDDCIVTLNIEELKYLLDVQSYNLWNDLNRFIIAPTVKEINELAEDIHVEYKPQRGDGRAYEKVTFIITGAKAKQMLEAREKRRKKLDGDRGAKDVTGRKVARQNEDNK